MHNNVYRHGLILAFIFMCLTSTGFSQENQPPQSQLPEMVVVAPPIIEGNAVDSYAGEKSVVTQEQISDLNAHDIA
jgi:hypothetical protein